MVKKLKTKLLTFLIVLFAVTSVTPVAYAHDAFFLQVLVDLNTMQYQGNVISDKAKAYQSEAKHIEAGLGDFSSIKNWDGPTSIGGYGDESKTDGKSAMVFTFPSHEVKKGFISEKTLNDATQKDAERAYNIRDRLIPGLNDTIVLMSGNSKDLSEEEFLELTETIASGGSYNGWSVSYSGDTASVSNGESTYEYTYRMKKGYNDSEDKLYDSEISGDNTYVSWQQLIYQGNYTYKVKGHSAIDAGEYNKPNAMERLVAEIFENVLNGLRNLLGLYDTNDLVFNQGDKSTRAWYLGAMNREWMTKVTGFHILFQGIAWSIISIAVIKNLFQRNLATINPSMRVSLIESIRDLFITGFLLAGLFQLINLLLILNYRIVDIFGANAVDFTNTAAINNYSNAISGIIMQFLYFFVGIYMNAVYIIRAITLAILISTAPIFVVSIAFGGKWKDLFGTWLKELTSNIFLQSFHAFALSFFMTIQTSSRGIEGLIVAFAMIPMTEFFRSLLTGTSGGMASKIGLSSIEKGATMAVGAAGIAGAINQGKKGNASSGGTGDTGIKDSSKLRENSENPKQPSNETPNSETTAETFASKQGGTYSEGTTDREPVTISSAGDSDSFSGGSNAMDANREKLTFMEKAAPVMAGAKTTAKVGAKVASTATKVGAGAGMAMAYGGSSGGLGMAGGIIAREGFNDIGKGIGSIASSFEKPQEQYLDNGENLLGAETLSNGNIAYHRDANTAREEGIANAYMDSDKNAVISYDTQKLATTDQYNVNAIKTLNSRGESAKLSSMGVERVSTNAKGHDVITYNEIGKRQLGIENINMSGSRLVETKENHQTPKQVKTYSVGAVGDQKPSDGPRERRTGSSTQMGMDDFM